MHRTSTCTAAALAALAASTGAALAQEQIIASLPWGFGLTAGPVGTNYLPPEEARTTWICEDFTIATDMYLTRFHSIGTVFPAPAFVFDVNIRIYDDLPTVGTLILSSVPGTGAVQSAGLDIRFVSEFEGQFLRAGSYWVVWNASTNTSSNQRAIFWAQAGPHAVGGGLPDNAKQWNPGGALGYPGNIRQVPANLKGTGEIGVNFVLFGTPACYANCDRSTALPILNVDDFTCFINDFAAAQSLSPAQQIGHYANCDGSTTAPVLNVDDFTCFINAFAQGCP